MKNKANTFTLAASCIVIGSMAVPVFGLASWGLVLNILGVGSAVLGVIDLKSPYKKIWDPLKLYIDTPKTRLYPLILDEKQNNEGKTLRIKLPIGLSSDEFSKKATHLKEYFKANDITFKFNNGFLFINLKYNKLETTYDYEPIATKSPLAMPIGRSLKDIFILDILKAPHVLIAGETGSGKSTVLRVMITYLIHMKNVVIHLVDLKEGIEFSLFRKSSRVKTFAKTIPEAKKVIDYLLKETKRRYNLFYQTDCVNIEEYNRKFKSNKLNYEIIFIDEFADLADTDCIEILNEFFQKARAAGLHGVVATQRPCAKTLDTRLKANIPYVLGLKTMNRTNSQIIIDQSGLEELRGMGHGLVKTTELTEMQCFNLSTEKARDLIRHTYIKDNNINFIKKEKKELKDFSFLKNIVGDKVE